MLPPAYDDQQNLYEDWYDMVQLYSDTGADMTYMEQDAYESQEHEHLHAYGESAAADAYTEEASYTDFSPMGLSAEARYDQDSVYFLETNEQSGYQPDADVMDGYDADEGQEREPFEQIAGLLEPEDQDGRGTYDIVIGPEDSPVEEQTYAIAVEDGLYQQLLEDGPAVEGQYVANDEGQYVEIMEIVAYEDEQDEEYGRMYDDLPVVEHRMPDGLFGFVDPTESHPVAHVNKALYKVDKDKTRSHESSRRTGHPSNWAANELQIRYLNGDIDVENTLSFQANNPGRIRQVETGYMPWMEYGQRSSAGQQYGQA